MGILGVKAWSKRRTGALFLQQKLLVVKQMWTFDGISAMETDLLSLRTNAVHRHCNIHTTSRQHAPTKSPLFPSD